MTVLRLLVTLALLAAGCTDSGRDAARRIDPGAICRCVLWCDEGRRASDVVWACSVFGRLLVCQSNTCAFTGVTAPMEAPTEVP